MNRGRNILYRHRACLGQTVWMDMVYTVALECLWGPVGRMDDTCRVTLTD